MNLKRVCHLPKNTHHIFPRIGSLMFSPLDAIKALPGLEMMIFFVLKHFCFSIPTTITTESLANKYETCVVLILVMIMKLVHVWHCVLFRAADSVDELLYRNLICRAFRYYRCFCWQLKFIVLWNDVGGASITIRDEFHIVGIQMWRIYGVFMWFDGIGEFRKIRSRRSCQ